MLNKLYALDIETECAKPGCAAGECDHALIPHHARITVAAAAWEDNGSYHTQVFRDLAALAAFAKNKRFVGHNFKFDMKMLRHHGVPLTLDQYAADTALMGTASYEKVSEEYLEWYERQRKRLNKERRGNSHRKAGRHSLKTMAPYFLKVPAFWEAEDHNNDEYVSKDALYTLQLHGRMLELLKQQDTLSFYERYLLPWSRMFLRAEERGVLLDFDAIRRLEAQSTQELIEIERKLEKALAPANEEYRRRQKVDICIKYRNMETKAREKAAKTKAGLTSEKETSIQKKYATLYGAACEQIEQQINLSSPSQLLWLLRDFLKLDVTDLNGKDSTDKSVLEGLVSNEIVALILKHREHHKLIHTYFASYRDLASPKQTLHASFNLDIARTGRTSSNGPNLQNQPRELHEVFIARPGYKLITKDLSAIEPSVVAYYSEDPLLVDLIQKGGDFHGYNCNAILGTDWPLSMLKKEHPVERDLAKEVGLAVLYGAGKGRIFACSKNRGFNLSEHDCREGVERLRAAWPDVTKFKKAVDKIADSGAAIENFFGRKRVFEPDEVYMKAFNSLIQGTASDLLLESARRAQEEFDVKGIDAHLLMAVHDEVVFEVPAERAQECDEIITRHMTSWELNTAMGPVPLRVEGKVSDKWEK